MNRNKIYSKTHPWLTCLLLMAYCLCACNDNDMAAPEVQFSDQAIIVNPVLDASVDGTRAFVHENSNLKQDRLHIETYYSGTPEEYFRSDMLHNEGYWSFYSNNIPGQRYFWPLNRTLDFFAHFPVDLAASGLTYQWNNGSPEFTYVGPTETVNGTPSITEKSQEGTGREGYHEMIFAYRTECPRTDNGQVDLQFHRPFALVVFKLNESIRCTIQSVKITGIKNSGTVVCKPEKDGTPGSPESYVTWTPSGESNVNILADFSAFSDVNHGIRYPQDINGDAELAQPFVVVPQDLTADSRIEVTYKAEGSSRFSTVKSTLNKAMLANTTTEVNEWKPGNKYVYALTLNGAADEIFVAVQITDWIIEGETETEVH